MEFTFTTEESVPRADEIVSYLIGPRLWIPKLDYPDFDAWIDKVHCQLKSETKRAILALTKGNVVGAILYQRHQLDPDVLEIKNITVRPDQRGRYLASFMLRNAEIEGSRDFGSHSVCVDAKAHNTAIRTYLFKNGYLPKTTADLYGLGSGVDVVYSKKLRL